MQKDAEQPEEEEEEKVVGPAPKMWKKRNKERRLQREYKVCKEGCVHTVLSDCVLRCP